MRRLLAFFIFLFSINGALALYPVKEEERRFGLTYKRLNTPYKGYPSDEMILPYFKYKKSFWDVEDWVVRAIFFNYESFQTGFQLSFEPVGYGGAKDGVTTELGNTNYSLPLGIYHLQKFAYIDCLVQVLVSFWGGDQGLIRRLSVQKDFYLFNDIFLRPYFQIELLSQSYVNYYYGVKEPTASLDVYEAGSATNYIIGAHLGYQVLKKVFFNASINYTKFHSSITQSPLVNRSQVIEWLASLSVEI
ncbi:MAG: hypothetical protein A2577_00605 [Bdellovibrionales bacterium RIFOXYD1_FULL_36_51]|nr:MAG: hypothetical protein A2181_06150 [Bdellovibrionales bacterium RIFOXYA1_FULL_38_20]OFZ49295.1 MAG: hypothetical protein A2417_17325 [Bdellovibrionales bacterium RIFOXYC1_FULL_37_79]OFZ61556.1 MAG: hypothetical protein A2577_00605 [Bdellovibrionales bacterium RIFOXYD1_FULL_36_51]